MLCGDEEGPRDRIGWMQSSQDFNVGMYEKVYMYISDVGSGWKREFFELVFGGAGNALSHLAVVEEGALQEGSEDWGRVRWSEVTWVAKALARLRWVEV